jgi:hypothetical protein
LTLSPAPFDAQVPTLNEAGLLQPLEQSGLCAGKLQVQPCPLCPVNDGRPEKGGLS